jgi:hypothetical protein
MNQFRISEETFWRNYFYRVSLIRQANELSSMAQEGGRESDPTSRANSTDVEPAGRRSSAQICCVVSVCCLVQWLWQGTGACGCCLVRPWKHPASRLLLYVQEVL